jgi:hypothetical protein
MAVVALSHNITRQEDFEGTPGGTIGSTGGGPGAGAEAGLHYEASQCLARRVGSTNTDVGFDYAHNDIGTVNMTTTGFHIWLVKAFTALSAVINPAGTKVGIGDADGSMYKFQIGDDGTMGDDADFALPPKGGYVLLPIEARVNAWHNESREATPDITVADTVELLHNVSATTGAGTSQALDSIDYTTDGLFLVGGDSTDPDGTFQDFVDADEGAGLTGASRAGLWQSGAAGIIAALTNYVGRTDAGTTTATVFTDSGFTVVFPGGFVSEGRNGLFFDLGNASTVVTLTDGSISGSDKRFGGRSRLKRYFDTEFDVTGGATDQIAITGHGFRDGDAVIYSAEGGTEDIGPDATTGEAEFNNATAGAVGTGPYWYVINVDADTIQLAATAQLAYAATPTATGLTASTAGNGERHSLTRAPDTRPNIEFNGTAGDALLTRVNLIQTRIITLTSVVELDSCIISQGRQLILGSGLLTDCTISQPTVNIGEAYLEADTAANLSNAVNGSQFISGGEGHAIELTTTATGGASLTNVNFTGYWAGDADNTGGNGFNASTGVASNQITFDAVHNMTTGDPVYYSDEGGTAITGLTDQALYFVEVVDTDTVYMHETAASAALGATGNRLSLTAGSSETHKLYSANAAFYNSTGAALTINVSGGNSPSVRNSAGSTTTVENTVTLTVNVEDQAGVAIQNARVAIYEGTDPLNLGTQLMNELTTAGGVATESYVFSVSQPITIRVRKNSAADNPRYQPFITTGTITSDGFTTTAVLIVDTIAE